MRRLDVILKSKTVWGAVFTAAAWLLKQDHIGVIEIVQAAGALLSAIGIRDAITQGRS